MSHDGMEQQERMREMSWRVNLYDNRWSSNMSRSQSWWIWMTD